MPIDPSLAPYLRRVEKLGAELDRRRAEALLLMPYDEGACPLPSAIVNAQLTKAYRMLMPTAEAPWGSLAVVSSLDRLEVTGIRDGDNKPAERAAWGAWQDNQMDNESKLVHHASLVTGRAFALIWADKNGQPEISLDNSEQMVVEYEEGSRRKRVAALRRWVDADGRPMANLYLPEAIFKFQGPKKSTGMNGTDPSSGGSLWEPRLVDGEQWPLPNPLGVVPVVELAVNRRLKPGAFGWARGEFAHCTGLIDRINLLTFLGLVVAFWQGFPLRAVIGDRILITDDGTPFGTPTTQAEGGTPVPPFKVNADTVAQFEDPNTRLESFPAADRKNLSVYAELDQFATITRNPRHYFPQEGGMSNIAADTIRANEGSLHAKIGGDYKPSLGEGWEEVQRICTMIVAGNSRDVLSPRAELQWRDHEYRSLAERADAVSKLAAAGFPWVAIAEIALDGTQDQISRWGAEMSSNALGQLLADAQTEAQTPAANGNGATPEPAVA